MNPLENAAKYSGERKEVGIRLYPEARKVILEVPDYGHGIPRGEHDKVFEKLYRAGNLGERGGSSFGGRMLLE
jgi:K+-sensing histidine kinase KdpD